MRSMKILITGGAGFIGSHLADAYLNEGHDVVIVDDLSSGCLENIDSALSRGARFFQLDIGDSALEGLLLREKPDIVNHHAAQKSVRLSVEHPLDDARINIMGLLNVLESCRKAGTSRLLFASSGGVVYGEQSQFPATENHALRPMSPYGVSKLSSEYYLDYYALQWGFSSVALRYANIYGPRQDPQGEAGVVAIFCNRMVENSPTIIYGDGGQTRDFVYVADIVAANLKATEWLSTQSAGAYRAWNIGTGLETDIVTLHRVLADHSGYKGALAFEEAKLGEQRRSVLSSRSFEEATSWRSKTAISEGLSQTYDWFQLKQTKNEPVARAALNA